MAGTVVTVTVPQALLSAAADGIVELQIGCHDDGLWDHDTWVRLPEIVRRWVVAVLLLVLVGFVWCWHVWPAGGPA